MTIKYEILAHGADEALRKKLTEEYCCYGSIGPKFKYMERTKAGFKSHRYFTYGKFRGIKLHLGATDPYGMDTTNVDRKRYEKMFDRIGFFKWLGSSSDGQSMSKSRTLRTPRRRRSRGTPAPRTRSPTV